MKIALIEWEDAYSTGGWHTIDEEHDNVSSCITIGLLCLEDTEKVVIAQSRSKNSGNVADTIAIPKGCIKRIRYLKVG